MKRTLDIDFTSFSHSRPETHFVERDITLKPDFFIMEANVNTGCF